MPSSSGNVDLSCLTVYFSLWITPKASPGSWAWCETSFRSTWQLQLGHPSWDAPVMMQLWCCQAHSVIIIVCICPRWLLGTGASLSLSSSVSIIRPGVYQAPVRDVSGTSPRNKYHYLYFMEDETDAQRIKGLVQGSTVLWLRCIPSSTWHQMLSWQRRGKRLWWKPL